MTEQQKKEVTDLGFRIGDNDARHGVAVSYEAIPELEVIKKLILTLNFDEEIEYWDAYQKSPTDPGGYVTALRLDEERVAYMEGNDGWTSSWYIVSVEEMARHIQKNWDKDCNRGMYLNKVWIKQNKYITREKIFKDLHRMER